jgi:hypothetical protein
MAKTWLTQAPVLLDHFGEQRVRVDFSLHDGVRVAVENHSDRLGGGGVRIGDGNDRDGRNVGFESLRGGLDASGVSDEDGLDQPFLGREQRSAQRIVILGADDRRLQRRQSRRESDELGEMVDRVDDERRKMARLDG